MIKIIDKEILNKLPEIDTQKYNVFYASLSELNTIAKEFNNHVEGKNGLIDFFNLPKDTKVIALNESDKKPIWADAKYWSVHYNRKLEIVNLSDGSQIFTDNDPRAIYGIKKENFENQNYIFERFTPAQAKQNAVLIPKLDNLNQNKNNNENLDIELLNKDFLKKDFNDWLDTKIKLKLEENIDILIYWDKEIQAWQAKFNNIVNPQIFRSKEFSNLIFVTIYRIDYTDQLVDGYDLTVPGYETFMSVDGAILSNTINVHVPGLPEAQKDIREKLLPSKQVYSSRVFDEKTGLKVVNPIKQDLLLGLYGTLISKAKNKHVFNTRAEAVKAIKSGKISLSDEIEILEEAEG